MSTTTMQLSNRLAELVKEGRLLGEAAEGRDLTHAELARIDAISNEFSQVEAKLQIANAEERASAPIPAKTAPPPVINGFGAYGQASHSQPPARGATTISGIRTAPTAGTGGFSTFGGFLAAVRGAASGQTDGRLMNAVTTYGGESAGPDGGFAVPPSWQKEIMTAGDPLNMVSRLLPGSFENAFWVCHSSVLPYVWALTLGQQPVVVQDATKSPYGAPLGRPIFVCEHCKDYNTVGDFFLVSPDGYGLAVKSGGLRTDTSIHFGFDAGLQSFRATLRIGGTPLLSAAVARANGSATQSHIVCLGVRS